MSLLRAVIDRVTETARLMVGQSSYRAYLAHMAACHPDMPPMNETTFFRHRPLRRQERRALLLGRALGFFNNGEASHP